MRRSRRFRRPDDGDRRELAIQEDRRLRHDQVSLEVLTAKWWFVEVRKAQPGSRVGDRWCVAGLVLPHLEVHRLGRSDADQDAKNLDTGDPLSEGWIQAGAALLDRREVESSGVGDELQVGCRCQVLVSSWYRGVLPGRDRWYRLREGVVERWIWVLGAAPVPGPPAGVERELHEIGQPLLGLIGTCGLAARQRAETLEAYR